MNFTRFGWTLSWLKYDLFGKTLISLVLRWLWLVCCNYDLHCREVKLQLLGQSMTNLIELLQRQWKFHCFGWSDKFQLISLKFNDFAQSSLEVLAFTAFILYFILLDFICIFYCRLDSGVQKKNALLLWGEPLWYHPSCSERKTYNIHSFIVIVS